MPPETESAPFGPRLRLGISTCLLGENVRYNGGHQYDPYLVETLGQYVEWVPVCPEVETGLSTPREAMRLTGGPNRPRLVTIKTGVDLTDRMQDWARQRLEELAPMGLNGFVFKSGSPSSGRFRVRVYGDNGIPVREGTGIFARAFVDRFPLLPVEEDGRLNDARLRENFIERAFAHYRWQEMLREEPTPGGLVRFHTAHKLTLLSHSTEHYRRLGRLVARAGATPWEELSGGYIGAFMEGLAVLTTPGKHANVLQHLLGYLKRDLGTEDKAEMLALIEDYRRGMLPLVVPITLLKHHLRRYPVPDWVHQQVYLNPYPSELMLRNHV